MEYDELSLVFAGDGMLTNRKNYFRKGMKV